MDARHTSLVYTQANKPGALFNFMRIGLLALWINEAYLLGYLSIIYREKSAIKLREYAHQIT